MSPARGHSKNRAPMPATGEQRSSQARRSRRFFPPAPGEAPTSWRGPICADEIPSTPCQRGVPRMLTFRGLFFFAAEKVPFGRLRGALRAGIQPDRSRSERIAAVPRRFTSVGRGSICSAPHDGHDARVVGVAGLPRRPPTRPSLHALYHTAPGSHLSYFLQKYELYPLGPGL